MQKTIGVLGGMGPAATVELFSRIVNNTDAKRDDEHVKIVIINDPTIPDRTRYILGKGESPVPKLKQNLIKLAEAGADVAMIPCMTAHTFITELEYDSPIRIINAIELVEKRLSNKELNIQKVGLLATTGSIKTQVFQKQLTKKVIVPNNENQKMLMEVIYGENGIKAGYINTGIIEKINDIINELKKEGAQAVIAGCTEIGLVMNNENAVLPVIDPISLLAEEAIKIGANLGKYDYENRRAYN